MRIKWFSLFLMVTFALSACAQATPPASQAPTATIVQEETVVTTLPVSGQPAACQAVSMKPNPTIVALFPPITEEDWAIGRPDAPVTFLEYSDFQ